MTIDSSGSVTGLKQYENSVKKAEKTTESSFGKMIGTAKKLAVAFAGLAVVNTIKNIAVASIDAAARMQETQSKYNVVFDGLISKSNQWAQELRKDYGMSNRASKEYLASTQAILLGTGMLKDEAGKLSFNLVKMARDMASFNDKSPEQAINAVRSALTGEREALKQLGVVILESEVQKEAMIENNVKNAKTLTQAQKAQATYNLIMKKAAVQMGDVARNQNTYVFQMEKFKAIMEDVRTELGSKLLPVVTSLLTKFNQWVIEGDKITIFMNHLVESARFVAHGIMGLKLVFNGLIVGISKTAEIMYQFAIGPLNMVLEGLAYIGAIDTNPLENMNQFMKDFTGSAVEGLSKTLSSVDDVNKMFDSMKRTIKKTSDTHKKAVSGINTGLVKEKNNIDAVVKSIVDEKSGVKTLAKEETAVKNEIEKVTSAAQNSIGAINDQAMAVHKLAAAKRAMQNSGVSVAFGGVNTADNDSQVSVGYGTGGGSGRALNPNYESGSIDVQGFGGISLSDSIRESSARQSQNFNNFYFSQSLSRSDINNITAEQNRSAQR